MNKKQKTVQGYIVSVAKVSGGYRAVVGSRTYTAPSRAALQAEVSAALDASRIPDWVAALLLDALGTLLVSLAKTAAGKLSNKKPPKKVNYYRSRRK